MAWAVQSAATATMVSRTAVSAGPEQLRESGELRQDSSSVRGALDKGRRRDADLR
jgi:hypothetical protein